jgi:rfaE bifunctional protein nucleotidyltransferase chain/domain
VVELTAASKILTWPRARQWARELRRRDKVIVTVNGSFDLLHTGHLIFLEEAKQQGDVLFVGLNTDESIRAYKGPDRPLIPQRERALLLAGLQCVDYVVFIAAPEAGAAIIELVRPHIHANGSEYGPPQQWVEYPAMRKWGVRGYVCRRREGWSTTALLARLRKLTETAQAKM